MPSDGAEARPYVSVVGKAVALLDVLLVAGEELPLAELTRRLQMSRTTVYRLLITLEQHGFVKRTETGGYELGLHLFMLGSAVHAQEALTRLARPELEAVAQEFRVSTYLSVLNDDLAVCIERVDRGAVQLAAYRQGETLPLHVGAGPLILLASLPDDAVDRVLDKPLDRPTSATVASPQAIRARVTAARASGIAWADGDLEVGVVAVGAPVQDQERRTIAAVSAAGLAQQLSPERRTQLAEAIQRAASQIGYQIAVASGPVGGDGRSHGRRPVRAR